MIRALRSQLRRRTHARCLYVPLVREAEDPPWLAPALRAGIGVALSVAVAIMVLLVLEVRVPGAVERLPEWVRRSASPHAWWTVLAITIAGTVAASLYWRAHRQSESSFGIVTTACLVLVTFALAMPAYVECTGHQATVWTALSRTLALFLGTADDPFQNGGCDHRDVMPLALQVARLTAISTTFLSLVAFALAALSAQRDRLRALFARSITLVVGLDPLTKRFIEVVLRQTGRGGMLVVLELDRTNPLIGDVRRLGARVVFGDAKDRATLERLLLRGRRWDRRNALNAAYVLLPNASDAIAVADGILSVGSVPRTDGAYPRLVTRIDDPRQAEAWRRRQVRDDLVVLTDTLGLFRVTAQEVVDAALERAPRRLVVLGSSAMAVAVLEELVQHRREQAVRRPLPPLDVVVVAPDAEELLDDHARIQRWYGEAQPEGSRPSAIPYAPSAHAVDLALEPDVPTCVVVAVEPSAAQEQLTGRLALRHPGVRFLAWQEGTQGIGAGSVLTNVTSFGLTLVATHATSRGSLEVLPEDGWERVARRLHEEYIAAHRDSPAARTASRREWDDLSRFYRESNLRRVAVALQIVVRSGRTWLPPACGSRVPHRLSGGEIAALAHVEHESWCRYYLANGFRRGPRRERPGRTLRHPSLVAWEGLPEAERGYTRDSLAHCLEHLEAMGYIPYEAQARPPGHRFRRSGTVTAERLEAPWTWRTKTGASMAAQPGDWRISDGDGGSVWSITDADFRRTYAHVDGATYERQGAGWARPTSPWGTPRHPPRAGARTVRGSPRRPG